MVKFRLPMKRWPRVLLPEAMPSAVAGHDGCAVQHDPTMCRAHEFCIAAAPAHHFGNRQLFERRLNFGFKIRAEVRALSQVAESEDLLFAVADPLKPVDVRAPLF